MHIKKIGNMNALFMLMISAFFFPSVSALVTLRSIDHNGDAIAQAAVNTPFIVEVAVESPDGDTNTPEIVGIKQFIVQEKTHASTVNTIINGRRSVQKIYRFFVQSAHEGTFTIGPASAMVQGAKEHSDPLAIAIVKQVAAKLTEPLLRIVVDRNQVFIGEQVHCAIQFFMGKGTKLEGMTQPQFPDITATKIEGPFQARKEVDGVMRDCVEWRTLLTPQKSGTIAIPSTAAVYKTMSDRRAPSMFGFSFIFDDPFEQKQIFSNAVQLHVEPLPESSHKQAAFGVGQFKLASLKTDIKTATEGEGIVVRATVMGNGTIVRFPPLQLPDGLKYYESKQFIEESKSTERDKAYVFEYIVQSTKPGNFTIDAQEFVCFDPAEKKYRIVRTDPLTLTVTALQKTAKKESTPQPPAHNQQEQSVTPDAVDSSPFTLTRTWSSPEVASANWLLFYLFAFVCVFIGACLWLMRLYRWYRATYAADITARNAFKRARAQLKKSKQTNRADELYMIFVTLFAQRFHAPVQLVDEPFIREKLVSMSNEQYDAWNTFYATLLQVKFSSVHAVHDQEDIFKKAEQWLVILEKHIS